MTFPRLSRRSVLGRSALALVGFTLLFQIVLYAVSARLIVLPLIRSSTEDLAALMVLSAHTLATTPPAQRNAFRDHLWKQSRLRVEMTDAPPPHGQTSLLPFVRLLQDALTRKLDRPIAIVNIDSRYTLDIPTGGKTVRFTFPRDRVGTDPLSTLVYSFLAVLLLSFGMAWLVTGKVARPLRDLSEAAVQVGQGRLPRLEADIGVQELDELVNSFNAMAQQIQTLLQNRTTLLAGISHDLRSPLARAQVNAELAQETGDLTLLEDQQRYLHQMNQLIGEFLNFSKGVTATKGEDLDLAAFLADLCAESAGDGPTVQITGAAPPLHASRTALTRVVRNLIENARRYGGDQPVEVRLTTADSVVRIDVQDRGPGIPAANRERVFQPFVRLEDSRNPATGGSGLGLAIIREICRAHGWRVTLNDRPGGGLIARVEIPLTIAKG